MQLRASLVWCALAGVQLTYHAVCYRPRTRRKTKTKGGRRAGGTIREAPNVLCQLMSAQARYHQPVGMVPATDGGNLEDHLGSIKTEWTLHPDQWAVVGRSEDWPLCTRSSTLAFELYPHFFNS